MVNVIHAVVNVIGAVLVLATAQTDAIRVYWNTNTGPIIPPTPTPVPVPQPPFRNPAPVWENRSNDLPNPNPYIYILPPPSRPKYTDITQQRKLSQQESAVHPTITTPSASSTLAPTGRIITRPEQDNNQQVPAINSSQNQSQSHPNGHTVPSLSVQYVPNRGYNYYAVVPAHQEVPSKSAYLKTNDALLGKYQQYDKPNGRYNAKLKKYKAFEKAKYVPYYMYFGVPKQQNIYSTDSTKAVNNNL
ncbi:uncharacterized protein LOC129764553 [Toxorhynchites rutilus septentrionalis]|uniref:uncharacterized protein LOC129764553 n=1 Tax=Toxorhynchites rutilus septentrionalis TaxID=329112 RepID=UPI00247837C9|nr:uncharacterized protein LOC129764553 [Toxorhynchites rutilus septentrionalis]